MKSVTDIIQTTHLEMIWNGAIPPSELLNVYATISVSLGGSLLLRETLHNGERFIADVMLHTFRIDAGRAVIHA